MPQSLSALIFDVDGTLADTEIKAHLPAFNEAFARAAMPWKWDLPLYLELLKVTGGRERIRHFTNQYHPEIASRADFNSLVEKIHQDKRRVFSERVANKKIGFRAGVLNLIEQAHRYGMRLAIATTTSLESVNQLLAANMPVDFTLQKNFGFELIAAGDIVKYKKPASDIYHHCLEQLKLHPGQCLAIEDSANGLQAASQAGIATLITYNEITRSDDFAGAMAILPDLEKVTIEMLKYWHGLDSGEVIE